MARAWTEAQQKLATYTEAELAKWVKQEWKAPTNSYLLPRIVTRLAELRKKREVADAHARIAAFYGE